MKKSILLTMLFFLILVNSNAQVGISTNGVPPDPSAILDATSTTKGFLPPRMTSGERDAIISPARGLVIYNTDCNDLQAFNGTSWVPAGNVGDLPMPGPVAGEATPCIMANNLVYEIPPMPGASGYSWTVPPGCSIQSGQGTPTIVINAGMTGGTIGVTAFNDCYRSMMATIAITPFQSMLPEILITVSENPVCAGMPVTVSATPENGENLVYHWLVNDLPVGSSSATFTYIPSEADVVSCFLTSNAPCSSGIPSLSNLITMALIPGLLPGTISAGQSICAGEVPAPLTGTPPQNGTNPAFQWQQSADNILFTEIPGATDAAYQPGALSVTTHYRMIQDAAGTCNGPLATNGVTITVNPLLTVSVSVTASATTVCPGTTVTYTATPVNGGPTPMYQWKVNNVNSGTNSAVFLWTPVAGDLVKCVMTSSALCPSGPATSNAVSVSIVAAPPTPVQGSHIPGLTTVQWSWAPVTGATGYKWNTTNSYATATDMGTATTKYESGLTCGTTYTRYVWAYNTCLGSAVTILTQATLGCPPACGTPVTVNHSAGLVAPVTKTVTYASVTNIPGEPTKCWITRNLGASQQALSYDDGSEASAGWYWQFNRKQGYRHDGANVTPAWTITNIYENSGWVASNDPCSLELGAIWRIPTFSEYSNIDNGGGWTNWTGPYASALKLHAAGCIGYSSGSLYSRGSSGYYWCSEQTANNNASGLTFYTGGSYMNPYSKAYGFPVRCLHE